MSYRKQFDPDKFSTTRAANVPPPTGDRRDGLVYIYDDDIVLAVNVALATGRPLLVRGPSGSGKSSLARHVARVLKRRYYEDVISSSTQARDLLWKFDTVAQLADASAGTKGEPSQYVQPGILWWAFDPKSAETVTPAKNPNAGDSSDEAVVLLDEIDKADPDVPNNLLVPLGSSEFKVKFPGREVPVKAETPPLVIITTNDERDLPNAFLRRCVVMRLDRPDAKQLAAIAAAHFGPDEDNLYAPIAELVGKLSEEKERAGAVAPSTAEYLDAISACRKLGVGPAKKKKVWEQVARAVLEKPRPDEETAATR